MNNNKNIPLIPLSEIQRHTAKNNCWLIIDGLVYDVTSYLNDHPGGFEVFLQNAGGDATKGFNNAEHSEQAKKDMANFLIGRAVENEVIQTKIVRFLVKNKKFIQNIMQMVSVLVISTLIMKLFATDHSDPKDHAA